MRKIILTVLRLSFCILGLAGFGIIVTEILKKWQVAGKYLIPVCFIAPILVLFISREIVKSTYLTDHQIISPRMQKTAATVLNIIFIILSIVICVSIPFIWFGTIEELGHRGGW